MGIEINESAFSDESFQRFQLRLLDNLEALSALLAQPGFGLAKEGSKVLGAELEMYIIDAAGQPLCINQELLDEAKDPQLTLELNRYNLEYNLSPYAINEHPFAATEREILTQLERLNNLARPRGGRVIPIGILPTLNPSHFGPACLTDRQRYRTLVEQLIKRRGCQFHIDINGEHPLQLDMNDVTLEGANTSFQIHYRVNPEHFADTYNAFQLVTPLVLAIAGNSPGLFGHMLWQETRIPLFKQAIDSRVKDRYTWHEPARVGFGQGWVRRSALEMFQELVSIHSPLLPVCSDEDPKQPLQQGRVPTLAELRLHQSSVWLWNRPVYDHADGGHLRIELRALPAGPTAIDMVANAVFYIGLAAYYRPHMQTLMPALPFGLAEHNFYRAAQSGFEAKLVWPELGQSGCRQQTVAELLGDALLAAAQGLEQLGISHEESARYLDVIEARIATRQTGARWQAERIKYYQSTQPESDSLRLMLEDYVRYSLSNRPVSEWPRPTTH